MNDDGEGCLLVIMACILCILFGGTISDGCSRKQFEDEAVKLGHAHYYLDENNNKQWEWLSPPNNIVEKTEETEKEEYKNEQ